MPTYAETRDYLFSLRDRGSKYGLERMQRFVDELGHPERKYPSIHVAGTNGKGSVCAMLESVYRANGYRTGLYTSPHLLHQSERIQVDRRLIPEAKIVAYTDQLKPIAERLGAGKPEEHPSFFEFMTAMAFIHFAEEKVDIAILETGLGGRLDATNVVDPELAVITSVSLDHTELLGDTLEKIATEKAGILKRGRPALIGRLPESAASAVRAIAKERDCPFYTFDERFRDPTELPETNLAGDFQRLNAGLALGAIELLAERFPVHSTDALRKVDWAGRWQRVELDDRTLILDATHNPEGCTALEVNLANLVAESGSRPIIIAGTLGDDRARGLMPTVARHAAGIYLVQPAQPRACPTSFLAACLPAETAFPVTHSSVSELFPSPGCCSAGKPGDTIVVTGSIYLLGEVLQAVRGETNASARLQDKI